MAPESERYAVQVVRAAYDYLTKVRYLSGNPWTAVKDPQVDTRSEAIDVGRALSAEAWKAVIDELGRRAEDEDNAQDRIALAAILLMGDSGMRRHEVAAALRSKFRPSPHVPGVWMLEVLGKGRKWRRVPVSPRTAGALRAHWRDRGLDFDRPAPGLHLLSPLVVPKTQAALKRHGGDVPAGYTANGLADVVKGALRRCAPDLAAQVTDVDLPLLSNEDLVQVANTTPHAFRHTFGTLSVQNQMELNVTQDILGHASLSTTSLYVRAKEQRMAAAAAKYYGLGHTDTPTVDSGDAS